MSKRDDHIEYLEDERKKLWQEFRALESKFQSVVETMQVLGTHVSLLDNAVEKKTSDYELEAKNASASATRYKNRALKSSEDARHASGVLLDLVNRSNEFSERFESYDSRFNESESHYIEFEKTLDQLNNRVAELTAKEATVEQSLVQASQALVKAEEMVENIRMVEANVVSVQTKITSVHSNVIKRGNEITTLYDEVFGYTTEDSDTNEQIKVSGLKDELQDAYSSLKKELLDSRSNIQKFHEDVHVKFDSFIERKDEQFDSIKNKIQSLLPDAMTAGLSHAYEKKRISEEGERDKSEKTFTRCIWILTLISVIPVMVSVYLLFQNRPLDDVIQKIPRLILGILPLYAPAFWFAIVSSKRIKLSKRLIEEYTHKESLSKTFEGLSTQVASLEDGEVSRDLRLRLLYNMVTVSSDNPGRLISDYNSSDNPILDVLDKSTSLTKSLEKITAIPGIERLLQVIEKRRKVRLAKIGESLEENVDRRRVGSDTPE
ncbi:MAG: hypothetical protein QM627_03255 [Luteolibacter sp.]